MASCFTTGTELKKHHTRTAKGLLDFKPDEPEKVTDLAPNLISFLHGELGYIDRPGDQEVLPYTCFQHPEYTWLHRVWYA